MQLTRGINSKGEERVASRGIRPRRARQGRARFLAWTLASQGKRVAVIERRNVGGSCPNIACAPARTSSTAPRSPPTSAAARSSASPRTAGRSTCQRPRPQAQNGRRPAPSGKSEASGAELVMGNGRFVAPRTVEVPLHAGGTRPSAARPSSSTPARVPGSTTPGTAGGAAADARRGAGAGPRPRTPDRPGRRLRRARAGGGHAPLRQPRDGRRTERLAHPPRRPDVTAAIEQLFRDEGIEVLTGAAVRRVEGGSGESVRLHATRRRDRGDGPSGRGGRTPNTDGIGLEAAGVEDERGHVKVNERLQTTAEGRLGGRRLRRQPVFHAHRLR